MLLRGIKFSCKSCISDWESEVLFWKWGQLSHFYLLKFIKTIRKHITNLGNQLRSFEYFVIIKCLFYHILTVYRIFTLNKKTCLKNWFKFFFIWMCFWFLFSDLLIQVKSNAIFNVSWQTNIPWNGMFYHFIDYPKNEYRTRKRENRECS